MPVILHLETATKVCSVSLADNGRELYTREILSENFTHAENLTLFIEHVLAETGKKYSDIDAVAVSEGPGSYTGLRIGVSTAKGLCYALDRPLISVNSLQSLAALISPENGLISPLFDAMRMEVYAAVFDQKLNPVLSTQAVILDENSFSGLLESNSILFCGPGAPKLSHILQHPHARFDLSTQVSAKGMTGLAHDKFMQSDFVDVAYFEPFYLKDFIAGEAKKPL